MHTFPSPHQARCKRASRCFRLAPVQEEVEIEYVSAPAELLLPELAPAAAAEGEQPGEAAAAAAMDAEGGEEGGGGAGLGLGAAPGLGLGGLGYGGEPAAAPAPQVRCACAVTLWTAAVGPAVCPLWRMGLCGRRLAAPLGRSSVGGF